jgi:tetratricopeptide (TPR) repeat protein
MLIPRTALAALLAAGVATLVLFPVAAARGDAPAQAPAGSGSGSGSGSTSSAGTSADSGPLHRDPDNKAGLAEWMERCIQGNAKYLAHDIPGAIDLYRQAIQLAPKRPLPHYLLAEAQLGAGHLQDAEAALHDAEQASDDRDPNVRGKILFALADAQERGKKWEGAKAAWKTYAEYAAKHGDAGMAPPTPAARIQAIDDALRQDAAYEAVRERIANEGKDAGAPDAKAK